MHQNVKPAAIGARRASNVVNDWHVSGSEVSTSQAAKEERTRAELRGDDICDACGITVRSSAPVLALCRKLIEAGHDPPGPLWAIAPRRWRSSSPASAGALGSRSIPKVPALLPIVRCAQ